MAGYIEVQSILEGVKSLMPTVTKMAKKINRLEAKNRELEENLFRLAKATGQVRHMAQRRLRKQANHHTVDQRDGRKSR